MLHRTGAKPLQGLAHFVRFRTKSSMIVPARTLNLKNCPFVSRRVPPQPALRRVSRSLVIDAPLFFT